MNEDLLLSQHGLRKETLVSADLTDELIKEIADYFRYIFCNAYQQYLFDPKVGLALPPSARFSDREGYIPLEDLDSPLPIESHKELIFWHDPEVTLKRMQEKFKHQAHLVLLRDKKTGQLRGMTFGYEATLEEAFEHEEWYNPHHYSQLEESPYLREYTAFEAAINKVIAGNRIKFDSVLGNKESIDADSLAYVWNCIALSPELQGKGFGEKIIRMFFEHLAMNIKDERLQLAEVIPNTTAHQLELKYGSIDVPGALGTQNPIGLMIASQQEFSHRVISHKR